MAKTLFVVSINDDVGLQFQGTIRSLIRLSQFSTKVSSPKAVPAMMVGSGSPRHLRAILRLHGKGWPHNETPRFGSGARREATFPLQSRFFLDPENNFAQWQ
jgi:hypothetical protein